MANKDNYIEVFVDFVDTQKLHVLAKTESSDLGHLNGFLIETIRENVYYTTDKWAIAL